VKSFKVCMIAVVLLIFCLSALAEVSSSDDFSFHNGIMFNMTEDEVKQIEESNGYKWERSTATGPMVRGNILGIDNAVIRFYFDSFYETSPKRMQPEGIQEGNLMGCHYNFNTECFSRVYEAVSNKYGPATFGEGNNPTITDIWVYDSNYLPIHEASWQKSVYGYPNKNIKQWIIPYGESCIFIELYDSYAELFGIGSYETDMNYYVLSVSEYEAIKNTTERYNNDI